MNKLQKLLSIRSWTVRVLERGDKWGLDNCLTFEEDHLTVEFYDRRQSVEKFGEHGQFVSRYHLSTLLEREGCSSLALMGHVTDWTVRAADMAIIIAWLRRFEE